MKTDNTVIVDYELAISRDEAYRGTRRILARNFKRLAVTIPPGVADGTIIRLNGARNITDGFAGDLLIKIKVKKRYRTIVFASAIVAVFLIITLVALLNALNDPVNEIDFIGDVNGDSAIDYVTRIYNSNPPSMFIEGEPVKLVNNPDAKNPTWQQLCRFLASDNTDRNLYIPLSYECGHFARDVHNNAEAAGIKAAWVGVWFHNNDTGHAINAFNVVDIGIVYIDCSGIDASLRHSSRDYSGSFDMVVYIDKGKDIGEVHISKAESFEYEFYEQYNQIWQQYNEMVQDYNDEIEKFNLEIEGRVLYEGSAEDIRMSLWEADLIEFEQELIELESQLADVHTDSIGKVEAVEMYW